MEKSINFNNYEFYYSLMGNQDLPTILFLHGFMGDHKSFEPIMSLLSNQFSCLALDLPGHGKTKVIGGDECYTMPQTAEAVIKVLDKLDIQKCFLVGYSMGGRLALYLTLKFSQRFYKVVLESASPGLKTEEECLQRIKSDKDLADKLEISDFSDFLEKWYQNPLFASLKEKPDFEKLWKERLKNNPFELAKSLRNLSTGLQPSLWNELKHNEIPLLLLVGEKDEKFKQINTEMATCCPSSTLKIISNTGHNIHWENMITFVKEIRQFFLKF